MSAEQSSARDATVADEARLKALVQVTALRFKTPRPVPFGALIVHTQSGEALMRARNSVALENDSPPDAGGFRHLEHPQGISEEGAAT